MAKASESNLNTAVSTESAPTLSAIAEQVGVSRVAVGRVLLGTGAGRVRVADRTAAKIRRVAKQMDYRPNRMARQLKGCASDLIGVVIDSRSQSVFFQRLSAIEQQAAKHGYRLMIGQTHGDLDQLRGYCNDFASRGVDGVICITHRYPGYGHKVAEMFARLKNVVFIGQPASKRDDLNVVAIDTAAGIRKAIRHLVEQGRQRIGLPIFSSGTYAMERRVVGYHEGLKQLGLQSDERYIINVGPSQNFDMDSAVLPAVNKLIDDLDADAVIATNDSMAVQAIKHLKQRGLRVPEDVAVIGFDNMELARMYEPAVTSIDQNTGAVSAAAMKMLLKLTSGESLKAKDRYVVIEPDLVIRESTASGAVLSDAAAE